MKNKIILSILAFIIILGISLSGDVRAAYEVESPKLPITTNIYLEDDNENVIVLEDADFNYELIPITDDSPLPSSGDIEDGKWKISIPCDYGEYYVEPILFTKPGIYEYKFKPILGDYEYLVYDEKEYIIIYDVTNVNDLDLNVNILVTDENREIKYDGLIFDNYYFPPEEPIDPDHKTSPDDEGNINTSDIQVWMYIGLFIIFESVICIECKRMIKN